MPSRLWLLACIVLAAAGLVSRKERQFLMASITDINNNIDTLAASVTALESKLGSVTPVAPVATQEDLDTINDKITAINTQINTIPVPAG